METEFMAYSVFTSSCRRTLQDLTTCDPLAPVFQVRGLQTVRKEVISDAFKGHAFPVASVNCPARPQRKTARRGTVTRKMPSAAGEVI